MAILVASLISTCMNNTSFASEIHGKVKMLDSKEWSTGDASGSFTEVPFTHNFKTNSVKAYAKGVDDTAKKDTNVIAKGEHSFLVVNQTEYNLQCSYEFSLCLDVDSCIYKLQNFELGSNASMGNQTNSNTTKYIHYAGTYYSGADTIIKCGQQDQAAGRGTIKVN